MCTTPESPISHTSLINSTARWSWILWPCNPVVPPPGNVLYFASHPCCAWRCGQPTSATPDLRQFCLANWKDQLPVFLLVFCCFGFFSSCAILLHLLNSSLESIWKLLCKEKGKQQLICGKRKREGGFLNLLQNTMGKWLNGKFKSKAHKKASLR